MLSHLSLIINIHNSVDANAHIWRVLATFLVIIGFVVIAWGLGQWGMLELAATGTAAVISMLLQLLLRNGFIVLPDSKSDGARIEEGKNALRSIVAMFQAMLDRSSLLRLVLIAVGYGIGFILVRAAISVVLGAFIGNIFFAIGFGAIIAAFICFPTLLAGTMRALKSRKVVTR
jgi:hypothetical protein